MKYGRRDANHKAIVGHFRSLGFHVFDCADLPNCCDLVVTKGRTFYVEIKDGDKVPSARKLTEGEEIFKREVESHGGRYEVVESIDDVNKLYFKIMKNE
jgi:hypothetical protein